MLISQMLIESFLIKDKMASQVYILVLVYILHTVYLLY